MSAFVTIVSLVSQLSLNEKQALVALLGAPVQPAKTTKTTKTKKPADPSKPKATRKPSAYNKWYKANFATYRSKITSKDASLKGRELIKAIMVEMSAHWKSMTDDAKKVWADETSSSQSSAAPSDDDDEVLAEIEEMDD